MDVARIILLLEDEPIIAIDIEETLRSSGAFEVVSLDSCRAAMIWLSDSSPDLAVVDPKLKDGYCDAVASELVGRSVPFIVHSGYHEDATEERPIFEKGVWLTKPSLPEELLEVVDQLLG